MCVGITFRMNEFVPKNVSYDHLLNQTRLQQVTNAD